jgi:hypothetical protein
MGQQKITVTAVDTSEHQIPGSLNANIIGKTDLKMHQHQKSAV